MPQFRFRIEDKDGRVRQGRVTASSKVEAFNRIQQSGMKVLELNELFEAPQAGAPDIQAPSQSNFRAQRAEPYDLRYDSWWERLSEHIPGSVTANVFFSGLAVVGLLWAGWSYASGPASEASAPEPPRVSVNVTVLGQLSIEGIPDFGDVEMILDFPEVPFQVSKRWSELEHPSQGRFKWQADFVTAGSPRQMLVKARKPRYEEARSLPLGVRPNQSYDVELTLEPEKSKPRQR